MPDLAISAQRLTMVFGEGEARTVAVDDVSLNIPNGEMLYIVGPSGSGKTTLLSMISGILRPTSGVVFVIKADDNEVFRSTAIRGSTHATYDLKLSGVKTLELIVENAAASNAGNWALWLDPTLSR